MGHLIFRHNQCKRISLAVFSRLPRFTRMAESPQEMKKGRLLVKAALRCVGGQENGLEDDGVFDLEQNVRGGGPGIVDQGVVAVAAVDDGAAGIDDDGVVAVAAVNVSDGGVKAEGQRAAGAGVERDGVVAVAALDVNVGAVNDVELIVAVAAVHAAAAVAAVEDGNRVIAVFTGNIGRQRGQISGDRIAAVGAGNANGAAGFDVENEAFFAGGHVLDHHVAQADMHPGGELRNVVFDD